MPDLDREKQAAAEAAVAEVRDGMLLGLGTGSTVAFAIEALGRRCREGLSVRAVATSLRTEQAASAQGIAILDFANIAALDLAIDGVDAIDPAFRAIKGAGGAMLREKIVAQAAARMIAIGDSGKAVGQLPPGPLPVEVLPFARSFASRRIEDMGAQVVLRLTGATGNSPGEVYITDQDNIVLDCTAPEGLGLEAFAMMLQAVPGVMGHGFFRDEIDALYVGRGGKAHILEKTAKD